MFLEADSGRLRVPKKQHKNAFDRRAQSIPLLPTREYRVHLMTLDKCPRTSSMADPIAVAQDHCPPHEETPLVLYCPIVLHYADENAKRPCELRREEQSSSVFLGGLGSYERQL